MGAAAVKYMLDANICILLLGERAPPRLARRVLSCEEGELSTSAIVFAEVAWGSANGKLPPRDRLDRFVGDVTVLPFDAAAADRYATLPFRRGSFDRLIAAHALATGLTLVTNNEADFADIPGLAIENWTL